MATFEQFGKQLKSQKAKIIPMGFRSQVGFQQQISADTIRKIGCFPCKKQQLLCSHTHNMNQNNSHFYSSETNSRVLY